MFGPGGQPILMGQIPIIPQQFQHQHAPQSSGQVLPPKDLPHMSEEKLQEKGMPRCHIDMIWVRQYRFCIYASNMQTSSTS